MDAEEMAQLLRMNKEHYFAFACLMLANPAKATGVLYGAQIIRVSNFSATVPCIFSALSLGLGKISRLSLHH
jgi:hypothetical protein